MSLVSFESELFIRLRKGREREEEGEKATISRDCNMALIATTYHGMNRIG